VRAMTPGTPRGFCRTADAVRCADATIAPTTEAMVAAGAVLVPKRRALSADMSVEENLALGFYPRGRPRSSRAIA
jgi:ABC-type branched-subunit amino acid transport system ATPase component